jgi:hypothetical protein
LRPPINLILPSFYDRELEKESLEISPQRSQRKEEEENLTQWLKDTKVRDE